MKIKPSLNKYILLSFTTRLWLEVIVIMGNNRGMLSNKQDTFSDLLKVNKPFPRVCGKYWVRFKGRENNVKCCMNLTEVTFCDSGCSISSVTVGSVP